MESSTPSIKPQAQEEAIWAGKMILLIKATSGTDLLSHLQP